MNAAVRKTRSPVEQLAIVILLILAFVIGPYALMGESYPGGFMQCAPVTLLAILMLSRTYALFATVSATVTAFLLYFDAGSAIFEDLRFYLSAFTIVASIVIIAAVGLALARNLAQARATIERLEGRNVELRDRLAHSFRTALRLTPDPAGFASAEDYHREWSARLAALASAAEILRHDIERQAILPDLAETALLPFVPEGRLAIRLPRVLLPREAVVALGLTLQGLVTASIRAGALADRDGHVRLSGSMRGFDTLELNWREIGARAGSADHLRALDKATLASHEVFASTQISKETGGYTCTIVIAGARPR